jgi:MoaA/NifB/PqqE/SkfB family radical SAM enzyme
MSLSDIEKLSKSMKNPLNISLTGGEPFLRNDIDKIAKLFVENSGVPIISIPTNGMLTSRIVEKTEAMLLENPKTIFNIFVSLDGSEKTHNSIRGSNTAFQNANRTIAQLSKFKKKFTNFRLNVIFTINEINSGELKKVYQQISKKYDVNQFQVNFMRGKPKSAKHSVKDIEIYDDINKLISTDVKNGVRQGHEILGNFYSCINERYKDLITKTILERKFQTPCYAGTTNCVIYSNAEVHACEIRNDLCFGNLKDYDYDLKKLLSTPKNRKKIKDIRESKCFCTFECQQASNVAFNPKQLLVVILIWVKSKLGIRNEKK